jgi:uncharacterized protein YlaI
MLVTCPHCDYEVEIEDSEVEYMHKNGYIHDFECPECGELMDISVELKWTGEASIIEKDTCDECLGEFRARDLHYKGRCSPWPLKSGTNKLCPECFRKVLYGELDARRDYLATLTDDNKKNIKKTYHKGMKIHVNQIKDPYHAKRGSNIDVTVDSIKNGCIIVCSMINGELVNLYPGFDDFYIKEEI